MGHEYKIHWLNTAWIESPYGVSLMGEGRHPDVPGGQIRPHGSSSEIRRANGDLVSGTMVPAPAWFIEGHGRKILVDTGTGTAEEVLRVQKAYGVTPAMETLPEHDLVFQLEQLGVGAEEIEVVIHTHLHFDHVGSDEAFPNATFLVNAAELPWALCPPPYGVFYYKEFSHHVRAVMDQIHLVHGDYQVAPGIRMMHTGGHTLGHSSVFVQTDVGEVAITGDAAYNYRNLEFDWPQGALTDVPAAIQSLQTLKRADLYAINHDALFLELFPGGTIGGSPVPEATLDYMEKLKIPGSFALADYRDDLPGALFRAGRERQVDLT
jgi:glyoxylase-like metal-dependent hydrolase (beta-lactamase superfamily II)